LTKNPKPRPSARALALDANALDLFARIVEAGSFAQAARGLRLTRAAVSRRVGAIEATLGQPLFARTTRALALTEAGRRLAARARAVAEATDAARAALRARGTGLAGTLRVTAVPIFGQTVLAPLLARFQAAHPELRLELAFTNRRVDLLREEVDVAFRITRRPPPDWVARPLLPFRVLACARPRGGLPLAHPQALAHERCLVLGLPADSFSGHWSGPRGAGAEIELVPACTADDLVSLVGMAEAGDAIVFAPDFAIAGELAAGRLVDVLPGWALRLPEGQEVVALTLPLPAAPEAARALVQFVAAALA
jgi:DNA-binding transcriptional LysR family regulator